VRQIALNLLLNSCAAASPSGRIGLHVWREADALRLDIADTGSGMSQAELERLLGDGPLSPGGGVGLRIVRDLATRMGGFVDHVRTDGVTRVTVALPTQGSVQAAHGTGGPAC